MATVTTIMAIVIFNKLYRMTEAIQLFVRMECDIVCTQFLLHCWRKFTHRNCFLLKCLLLARTSNTEILHSKTIHRLEQPNEVHNINNPNRPEQWNCCCVFLVSGYHKITLFSIPTRT